MSIDVAQQAVNAAFQIGVTGAGLAAAWFVGNRLSYHWQELRKRRDLDLGAAEEFHRIYGEFFATWKAWNVSKKYRATCAPPSDSQWALLQRAAVAEGAFEALLVKLSSERELSEDDESDLARLRQGFQALRETIRVDKALDWPADPTKENAEKYAAFKELAARASLIFLGGRRGMSAYRRSGTVGEGGRAAETMKAVTLRKEDWYKATG
jgi:hypothetical protein